MKKITIVSLISFAFLFICSLIAKMTMHTFSGYKAPLIIGVGILALSGIIALIVRENTPVNIVCAVLSAVAMGIIMRSWYILRELEPSLAITTLISFGAVVYLWVYFALIRIPVIKESAPITVAVSVLYAILTLVAYLIIVFNTKTSFVSTVGYYAIMELSFIFAMSFEVNDKNELIRNLTLSTYSVLIVAIIVLVIALIAAAGGDGCDCDCGGCDCDGCDCDGCDCGSGSSSGKKKKAAKP